MRVAAFDCGTNSLRLLVAEPDGNGGLHELNRRTDIVRLGQGVDATGEFHPDALARTFRAVETYAGVVRSLDVPVEAIRFVATSASRDVLNHDEFYAGVQQRLGVLPDVISGDEEARLSFAGALAGIPDATDQVLVTDIGGGSTELILGRPDRTVESAVSLDVGSVRLTERLFSADPPTGADVAAAADLVDSLLAGSGLDLAGVETWIGVAGTMTTLAAMALELDAYDRSRVHRSRISVGTITDCLHQLSARTAEQIRKIPSMHPGRADVITAGVLVADRIGRRVGAAELVVSESDILDGIAIGMLSG